ncbi:MAG: isoaspartyl peptidase/L-asparaginase [Acidobacteria bacterium]|nr:MAG: isoaspartyl peptidase/L-asparaginase [Acidobacteriota bacterium]
MTAARSSILVALLLAVSCARPPAAPEGEGAEEPEPARQEWAIAIHGGAGVIPKDIPEEEKAQYFDALRQALSLGREALEQGAPSLEVVEKVVRFMEDAPQFNAGKGAVFTNAGTHELDAAIMDGRTRAAGAVSGLTTVKNPITLARLVMTDSRHVFLVGAGAEQFATEMGVERVDQEYFFTQKRYDAWQRALARERGEGGEGHGTVGAVALDRAGNLAAATSTGGLTNKRFGRVGDVPVIGAGTYADNATCAISATGKGEQFIRNTVAVDVAHRMAYAGQSLEEAARAVIEGVLEPGDGGVIGVDRWGTTVLVFNTPGMFRGAADASGRFAVAIWED